MHMKRPTILVLAALLIAAVVFGGTAAAKTLYKPENPERMAELGEFLYFDENLSDPDGQACASCHLPEVGFDDPDSDLPVSEGVVPGLFGNRNSPMSAYAMYAPIRYFDEVEGLWIGGQFWDSRATGHDLGDPLADQAIGPPLNPVEMANPDKATYVEEIANSEYAQLFEEVWGKNSLKNVKKAYDQAGLAVAAFERTALFAQFSSKYDYYLDQCLDAGVPAGDCALGLGDAVPVAESVFTGVEWAGFQLFMNGVNDNDGVLEQGEGAMCVLCHVADWTAEADYALDVVVPGWAPPGMVPPVFTDFTYDNLGVPKSDHPLLKDLPVDLGLGAVVGDPAENGKFKVMTLRNIGITFPYAHNGYFEGLIDITHFYNTRDNLPQCDPAFTGPVGKTCWPAPEYGDTVNFDELGNLGLSPGEENALVKFMETLTDGWWAP